MSENYEEDNSNFSKRFQNFLKNYQDRSFLIGFVFLESLFLALTFIAFLNAYDERFSPLRTGTKAFILFGGFSLLILIIGAVVSIIVYLSRISNNTRMNLSYQELIFEKLISNEASIEDYSQIKRDLMHGVLKHRK